MLVVSIVGLGLARPRSQGLLLRLQKSSVHLARPRLKQQDLQICCWLKYCGNTRQNHCYLAHFFTKVRTYKCCKTKTKTDTVIFCKTKTKTKVADARPKPVDSRVLVSILDLLMTSQCPNTKVFGLSSPPCANWMFNVIIIVQYNTTFAFRSLRTTAVHTSGTVAIVRVTVVYGWGFTKVCCLAIFHQPYRLIVFITTVGYLLTLPLFISSSKLVVKDRYLWRGLFLRRWEKVNPAWCYGLHPNN